jgi:hypothetical protein
MLTPSSVRFYLKNQSFCERRKDELRRRVWFTTSADLNLIFDENREKLWDSAYARRAQDL